MKKVLGKIFRNRIFTLFGILLFIAICIVSGMIIAYVQHESDPTEYAVAYFRAFMQQDYDKMYDMLDVQEGCYIDKDIYTAAMKEKRKNMVIDSYEFENPTEENDKDLVVVICRNEQANLNQKFNVYLNGKREGLELIPDYHIDIEELMVKNFSVTIPKEDSLELNGKKIDKKLATVTTDKAGNQIFTFAGVLGGDYKVSATNNYYAINENIKLEKKDTKIDLTKSEYTANDKCYNLINESSDVVIDQFYKAVRNRNSEKPKLIKCFDGDKKLIEKVKACVEESQDIVYWPDTKGIEDYSVSNMKINDLKKSVKVDREKNQFVLTCTYNYDYVSSTATEVYTSYVESYAGNCMSTMKLTYTVDNGNLVITNIKVINENKKD